MKIILIVITLFSFFYTGCSGSARFTSKDSPNEEQSSIRYGGDKDDTAPGTIRTPSDENILESVTGVASYYGKKFNGRETASGEIYNMNDLTAAHGSYPFNTKARITNLLNNKTVIVRINDRKPDFHGRIIDLSYAAAKELDMLIKGITKVQIDVLSWGE
ncbi:MAG: septal ring lytic transglycosylase RlpA family protein [Ignavibacteriaceae bacterium]